MKLNEAISKAREDVQHLMRDPKSGKSLNRFFARKETISMEQFEQLLTLKCTYNILRRGYNKEFVIDAANRSIIEQLYKYLTGDKLFQGDLFKGIYLQGKKGTGKTILMEGYVSVLGEFTNTVWHNLYQHSVMDDIKDRSKLDYTKVNLLIDDMGREVKQQNDYGNTIRPLISLFCKRYDNGTWNMATSNFSIATYSDYKLYGESADMFGDRIKQMFNILTLEGENRR